MHHIPARILKPEGASRLSRLLVLFAALVFATPAALTLPAFAQDPAPAAKPADHKPADHKPAPETKPADGKAPDAQATGAKPSDAKPAAPPAAKAEVPEQFKKVRAKLDAAKAELDAREKQLGHTDLTVADLTAIRDSAVTVTDEIRTLVTRLDAPLEAARERLAQLGPKPKDTQESADVAAERGEREAAVTRIDETQRLARALVVQGDQIVDRVSNRRRESFTRDLLQRSQPLVGPGLWTKVMGDVPRDTRALQSAVSDIGLLFSRNGSLTNLLFLGLAFGISVALYFGRRNIAPKGARRDAARTDPSRRAVMLAAWRVILLGTVPAVAGSYAVYYALDATNLLPSRLLPVAAAILGGSPSSPSWRPSATGCSAPRSRRGGRPR